MASVIENQVWRKVDRGCASGWVIWWPFNVARRRNVESVSFAKLRLEKMALWGVKNLRLLSENYNKRRRSLGAAWAQLGRSSTQHADENWMSKFPRFGQTCVVIQSTVPGIDTWYLYRTGTICHLGAQREISKFLAVLWSGCVFK